MKLRAAFLSSLAVASSQQPFEGNEHVHLLQKLHRGEIIEKVENTIANDKAIKQETNENEIEKNTKEQDAKSKLWPFGDIVRAVRKHFGSKIKESADVGKSSSKISSDKTAVSAKEPLPCSIVTDNHTVAIHLAAKAGHTIPHGCGHLKRLCAKVPAKLGGAATLKLLRQACPETCGVPCSEAIHHETCAVVYPCQFGMLTTVTRETIARGVECDAVACTPMTDNDKARCPWLTGTTGEKYVFECGDGSTCNAETGQGAVLGKRRTYDWDCCNTRGKRVKCPLNYPYMCNEPCPVCDQKGLSFSCQRKSCNGHGGYRTCANASSPQ